MLKLKTLILLLALSLAGCAAAPLAIPLAISAGGGGVAYTVTNIAYKTVSHPVKRVETATRGTLKKMAIVEEKKELSEDGVLMITAKTEKLDIYIELEKITPATTKIKVNAVRSVVFKDKATATEIIEETEKVLDAKTVKSARK